MNLLATHFTHTPTEADRYRNSLVGLAAGDAWGYQVEFIAHNKMKSYPVPAPAHTWRVSDDTQMAIAVNDALADLADDDMGDLDTVDTALAERFLDWYHDPDNNRAPGNTCLTSLRNLKSGHAWHTPRGAIARRGCGAVMRVAPTAFLADEYWAAMAALQALITHKHPAAVASALIVADAIRHANSRAGSFVRAALGTINAIYDGTHPWLSDAYLGDVIAPVLREGKTGTKSVQQYLIEGIEDAGHKGSESLLGALIAADDVQRRYREMSAALILRHDPCAGVGQGWNSPSAAALALLVADLATTGALTPSEALGWAATSNGDSDSIAAVAGAIIGATSSNSDFWAAYGVTPSFEARYARAIENAPAESMPLGEYPPEARRTPVRTSYTNHGSAALSAAVFLGGTSSSVGDKTLFGDYAVEASYEVDLIETDPDNPPFEDVDGEHIDVDDPYADLPASLWDSGFGANGYGSGMRNTGW